MGDLRKRTPVRRILEPLGQPHSQVGDVGSENRHEPAGQHRLDDVLDPVLGRRHDRLPPFKPRILSEDRAVQLLQRWAGLDSELVDEHAPGVVVDLERFRLPARSIEREHQLAAKPLAKRVLVGERLELADQVAVTACFELCLDPVLERREP